MMEGGPVLTAAQMRSAEQAAFDGGIDPYALMERAGAGAAEIVWRAGHGRDTLILCGPGNNGGDGFVIARLLRQRGVPVRIAGLAESRTDSARRARAAWGGPVEDIMTATPATQIVDALFGTGLARGLDAPVAERLRALVEGASFSHAIDLPSGVDTDSGALLSTVPRYNGCIALGAFKPAHLLYPAADRSGRLTLVDLDIPLPSTVGRLSPPRLERPGFDAHKYNRGLVVVIGGSMAGASHLAATAAAHSGAGAVRLLAPGGGMAVPHAIIQRHVGRPEALPDELADDRIGALLVGPGLGLDRDARARLAAALGAGRPMVLDADALGWLAQDRQAIVPPGSILTPHEGEFRRLFGDGEGSKIDRALEAARRVGSVVVYKGPDTVIAGPDGRAMVASGGSAWLSTAGTGDILAGLAAGRLAVRGDPFRAACEAVWLHGEAARRCGAAFVADDLLRALPAAIAARL